MLRSSYGALLFGQDSLFCGIGLALCEACRCDEKFTLGCGKELDAKDIRSVCVCVWCVCVWFAWVFSHGLTVCVLDRRGNAVTHDPHPFVWC